MERFQKKSILLLKINLFDCFFSVKLFNKGLSNISEIYPQEFQTSFLGPLASEGSRIRQIAGQASAFFIKLMVETFECLRVFSFAWSMCPAQIYK